MRDQEFHHGDYNREHIRGSRFYELILLGLSMLLVFLAYFATNECKAAYMTPAEFERAPKCSKQQCFGNNNGKSFLYYCESAWPKLSPAVCGV